MGCTGRLAVAVALEGCSGPTPTSQLSARLQVAVTATEIWFQADIRDYSSDGWVTTYSLEPGERLYGTFRDQEVGIFPNTYSGLPFDGFMPLPANAIVEGEELALVLDRGDELIRVAGTTPAPLVLTAPSMPKITEDITIRWTPRSVDAMRWEACKAYGPVPIDTGMIVVPAGLIFDRYCTDMVFTRERLTLPTTPLVSAFVFIAVDYPVTVTVTP